MPTRARSPAAEVTSILDDLRRVVRALRESSRASERRLGVTGAQLFVLQVLAHQPRLSMNELAERTRTHQSSVSVVVKRLVAAKLVHRVVSESDARRVELMVTARGRALLAKSPQASQERLIEGIEQLGSKDRRQLAAALQRLVDVMRLDDERPPAMFFEEETESGKRRRARASR